MSANSSSIVEAIGFASAPVATIAVAFFTYLSNKGNKNRDKIAEQEKKIKELEEATAKTKKELEKEIEAAKEKLDEAEAREDIMLRYIYASRHRDYKEGREPLALPEELALLK